MDVIKAIIAWFEELYATIMEFVAGFEKEWGFEKAE